MACASEFIKKCLWMSPHPSYSHPRTLAQLSYLGVWSFFFNCFFFFLLISPCEVNINSSRNNMINFQFSCTHKFSLIEWSLTILCLVWPWSIWIFLNFNYILVICRNPNIMFTIKCGVQGHMKPREYVQEWNTFSQMRENARN